MKLCNRRASRYGAGVSSTKPLITRLRDRFRAIVWLLAFVVLAKSAIASLCAFDGSLGARASDEAARIVASADVAASYDGDGASCWHAGSGGCHCTCVHASDLPAIASDWLAAPATGARIPPSSAGSHDTPLIPAIRPPIA
jgi:hypothetical protein